MLVCVLTMLALPLAASAGPPANDSFRAVWERTDAPVAEGLVARTWMWGPEAFTGELGEPYADSPDGVRTVQYFDKSRMEITHPGADPTELWYVTNGLLVIEMIIGNVQVGDRSFKYLEPAMTNIAGDTDDPTGPTYATFSPMYESNLLAAPPRQLGSVITERLSRHGNLREDPGLFEQGVTAAYLDTVTDHAVAAPFWAFMDSTGLVYEDGVLISGALFENPIFATGRPITEAYWANVKVAGTYQDVLLQCFERRCLTYTPGNPDGFQVEAGNVGRHYYAWRYRP